MCSSDLEYKLVKSQIFQIYTRVNSSIDQTVNASIGESVDGSVDQVCHV